MHTKNEAKRVTKRGGARKRGEKSTAKKRGAHAKDADGGRFEKPALKRLARRLEGSMLAGAAERLAAARAAKWNTRLEKEQAKLQQAEKKLKKRMAGKPNAVKRDEVEAQVLEWREKAREGYVPVWTRSGMEFFRDGSEISHGIFGDYIPLKKQTFEELKAKYGSKNWNGLK